MVDKACTGIVAEAIMKAELMDIKPADVDKFKATLSSEAKDCWNAQEAYESFPFSERKKVDKKILLYALEREQQKKK